MHFVLISLVTISLLFQFNQATEIRMSSYDMLIQANVTHKPSNNTWYLAETVYFQPFIHGDIKIRKDDIEMQVIYNLNSSKRIVIYDNRAMEMENILDFTWNGVQLPVATIRLINKLLIMGPVHYYSILKDTNYEEYKNESSLKFRSNDDGQPSFLSYKFIASITPWVALYELDEISVFNYINKDLITLKTVKSSALNNVTIETEPQFYVGFNETVTDHIKQLTVNTQFDLTKMITVLWIKYRRQGIDYDTVINFGSSLSSTSTIDGCAIESSDQNDKIAFAMLSLREIFRQNWTFRYTDGISIPTQYQHRDKFIMDKMEFNKKIGNFSYDLAITTLRVTKRPENISSDLVLQNLQVERKLYKKENKSSLEYQLIKTQKHFFSSYIKADHEFEYKIYTLNNKCFQDEKIDVLTLRMTLSKKLSPIEIYSFLNKLDGWNEVLVSMKIDDSNEASHKANQEKKFRELKISYKHLNQATFFSAKLNSESNVINFPIGSDSFNEQVMCKNYFGTYILLFIILIVAIVGTVIGFVATLCKSYRRTVRVSSSSQSISLATWKDS